MRNTRYSMNLVAALAAATSGAAQQPFDLDTGFETNLIQEYVSSALVMEDGKLVVSGRMVFEGNSTFTPNYGARLNWDGSRDMGFAEYPGMGGKLTRWSDKIYSGGQEVIRSNLDGTVDQSFGPMYESPYFSSLQGGDYHVFPDGRVLMTGTHLLDDTARGFVGPYRLIWFSNTGYLDTTRVHRQANGSILAINEDAQGRFLLSGFVSSYEGQSVGRIFRALPDGAFDPSFVAPLDPFGYSFKLQELGDGRILGVGRYKITGVSDTLGVVRLMADGSLDPSFTPVRISMQDGPPGLVPNVQDAHILADGRMIIGGRFDHINGVARGAIALLNADGSLSDDYFTGPGCGDYSGIEVNYRYIAGIVPAPNGEYYIHGAYVGYDDGTNNYPQQAFVSRLHGLNVGVREQAPLQVEAFPNPSAGQVTIQLDRADRADEVEVRDALGRSVLHQRLTSASMVLDLSQQAEGLYTVAVRSKGRAPVVKRVIIQR